MQYLSARWPTCTIASVRNGCLVRDVHHHSLSIKLLVAGANKSYSHTYIFTGGAHLPCYVGRVLPQFGEVFHADVQWDLHTKS